MSCKISDVALDVDGRNTNCSMQQRRKTGNNLQNVRLCILSNKNRFCMHIFFFFVIQTFYSSDNNNYVRVPKTFIVNETVLITLYKCPEIIKLIYEGRGRGIVIFFTQ